MQKNLPNFFFKFQNVGYFLHNSESNYPTVPESFLCIPVCTVPYFPDFELLHYLSLLKGRDELLDVETSVHEEATENLQ